MAANSALIGSILVGTGAGERMAARIFTVVLPIIVLLQLPSSGVVAAEFLLPCNAFAKLEVEPGAWCEYMFVEEAMGESDTSFLYIAVPENGDREAARFTLEIEGIPRGEGREKIAARLLVRKDIVAEGCSDSLHHFIEELFVRRGDGEIRRENPDDLKELGTGTGGSPWIVLGSDTVESAGSRFVCTVEGRTMSSEREVPMKRSTLVEKRVEEERAWFTSDVPLFELVLYEAVRIRSTDLDPPLPGVPVGGERTSRTTLRLIDYGHGAASIFEKTEEGGR